MNDIDDLGSKAARSIGWILAERWSSRLITLAVFAILARLLEPGEFGLISLATAVLAVLQVFVDSGFSKALVQRRELAAKDASTAFWTSLVVATLLYAGLALAAGPIATALGEPQLAPVLRVMGLVLPISALSATPAALLEREFQFKSLSIRQSLGTVAGATVAIPVALLGGGVWALALQALLAAIAGVVVLWTASPWRPRLEYSTDSLSALWKIGSSIVGIELLDAVQANIDKILIGVFFTPTELGYYYLAQRIGSILIELVTSVIARISLTTFSRVQDDLPRLNRIFRQLTFAAAAVSFPLFAFVAVLGPQIVPLVFGPGWEASVPLMWILAPGWAFGAIMYFDRPVLLATGHARTALGLAVLQAVIGIVAVFVLVPFGVVGVAVSRLSRILTWPIRLVLLHRYIGLQIWRYLGQIGRCILAIAPSIVLICLLQASSWASGAAAAWVFALPVALLGGISYGALLWLIAGAENRKVLRRAAAPTVAFLSRMSRRREH
ncbi:O-antigen/teichoic acid export membrane protein [Agromyces terreus]|uniref:O-antigen/teichoic acid export membrane protein n=1 Tax=Agromyces terreus TaxID=424795 RepID=A0A9X2GUX1_9MICO|nr:lipopolysaccharide biosynthesis protein [Agromyces terreus]MCP2369465.1 O-antigen/teichoic acid export membrane protein [Agromyces terreus]